MVAGRHVVNSTLHQSYSSVIHTRIVRLLQTITMNKGLNKIVGNIDNIYVQAYIEENRLSSVDQEFADKEGSIIKVNIGNKVS